MQLQEQICEVILKRMKEKKISQISLSQEMGISAPKLNMALRCKRRLTLEELAKICSALELNVDVVLGAKVSDETKNC